MARPFSALAGERGRRKIALTVSASKVCPICDTLFAGPTQWCPRCINSIRKATAPANLSLEDRDALRISVAQTLQAPVAETLKSSWGFKATIVSIVFGFLFAVFGTVLGVSLVSLWQDIKRHKQKVDTQVREEIAKQFETKTIRATVESVPKGEAKVILEAEIQPVVTNFMAEVAGWRTNLDAEAAFLGLATRARANHYQSFLRLVDLSVETNSIGRDAARVVQDIEDILARRRIPPSIFEDKRVYAEAGVHGHRYSGPFASDEMALKLRRGDPHPRNREAMVATVRELRQPMLTGALVKWLQDEDDLLAADEIARTVSEFTGNTFLARDFHRINEWWNANKTARTTWPYQVFDEALNAVNSGDYTNGARLFASVVKQDATADLSRALAMVAYLESGDTNTLTSLQPFKYPDGRLARFAAAKIMLEAGDLSNATAQVAAILTNYPTMPAMPKEGQYIWRKIDWPMVKDLTTATNSAK